MSIRETLEHENVTGIRVGRFNMGINTTFILYKVDNTLIDTGPSNQWNTVKKFVEESKINKVILTHHHEDHSGNAAKIANLLDLTPIAPQLSQRKLTHGFKIPPVQKVIWGSSEPVQTLEYPQNISLTDYLSVHPVHVPGHAKDLHCLHVPEKGWLFTGDLYISKSVYMLRADENLAEIVKSLQTALNLDFEIAFCAHRGILKNGKKSLTEKLNNIVQLCEKVQTMQKKGTPLKTITRRLLGSESFVSYASAFNFSKINLVKEAMKVPL